MAFSLRLERFIARLGIVSLGVGAMLGGFLLCVLASVVGIGQFSIAVGEIDKQVGFWSALNWSTSCLILFPLFLIFFVLQIDQCALICRNFSELRIITTSDGSPTDEGQIVAEWRTQLQTASKAFWLLLIATVIYNTSDWWMSCGKALLFGQLDNSRPIDWSTGSLYNKGPDRWPIFGFSILAYIYHGIVVFLYLSGLLYSLTFALFLHQISTRSGTFRMVFKREFWEHLSGFYRNIYWAILLGLYEAFLVRLQAMYIPTKAPNITEFLIQDWGLATLGPIADKLLKLNIGSTNFEPIPELADKIDNSSWAALALAGFSLLCLIGVTYLLYIVFLDTKSYFIAKIDDEHWRRSVGLPEFSKAQIEQMRKARFSETVLTNPSNLSLLILLPLISMAFLGIGMLLVAAVIFAVFQLLLTQIRQLSRSRNPLTGATRHPPS
jgi:hypothetical protein